MNRTAIWCAAGILAVTSAAHGQNMKLFRGEVSDSQCALNIHSLARSHQEMLKSKSMGGTANTCSVYCIEHLGGYWFCLRAKTVMTSSGSIAPTSCTDSKDRK